MVKYGMCIVWFDMVVYWWCGSGGGLCVGLIIVKLVGLVVECYCVVCWLWYVVGLIVKEFYLFDYVVICVLLSSWYVFLVWLE